MTKERVIYQDYHFETLQGIEDWEESYREYLNANGEEWDEQGFYDYVNDCTNAFYHDEKENLNVPLNNNIIAIADLGLWNGRRVGYNVMGGNLNEVLDYFGNDYLKVWYDGKNIRSASVHHDGTNHILFRELREDINEDAFLDRLYNGEIDIDNLRQLGRYTRPLNQVKEIYGW